jgi:hypothetical protein
MERPSVAAPRPEVPTQAARPEALVVDPEIVPHAPAPLNVLDLPRWSWVTEARAAERDESETPIFSTFPPGEEPDVWPALEPDRKNVWEDMAGGAVFALMLAALFFLYRATKDGVRSRPL